MSQPISARISEQVKVIRAGRGATRDELAELARAAGAPDSFTIAALRNLEIGRRPTTVDELVWLAAALHVPVSQLLDEHAALFGADEKPDAPGAVEGATRRAIQSLDGLDGKQLVLAEDAYALARSLDQGAGMAAAAISKELRATLADIWAGLAPDDDDDEDFGPS